MAPSLKHMEPSQNCREPSLRVQGTGTPGFIANNQNPSPGRALEGGRVKGVIFPNCSKRKVSPLPFLNQARNNKKEREKNQALSNLAGSQTRIRGVHLPPALPSRKQP